VVRGGMPGARGRPAARKRVPGQGQGGRMGGRSACLRPSRARAAPDGRFDIAAKA